MVLDPGITLSQPNSFDSEIRFVKLSNAAVFSLTALLVGCIALTPHAEAAANSRQSITVLPRSGPHQISSRRGMISLYFKITGLKWTARANRTTRGRGWVQMYLDKIPKDAYHVPDFKGGVNYNKPYPMGGSKYGVSIGFDIPWIRVHKGKHRLLIGLAHDNHVMYSATPASFGIKVK